MKKTYEEPEFITKKITFTANILGDSRPEIASEYVETSPTGDNEYDPFA